MILQAKQRLRATEEVCAECGETHLESSCEEPTTLSAKALNFKKLPFDSDPPEEFHEQFKKKFSGKEAEGKLWAYRRALRSYMDEPHYKTWLKALDKVQKENQMKLEAKQRLLSSKPRKVLLQYRSGRNTSCVVVTDEKVWAFIQREPGDTKGMAESLANFMFSINAGGTSEKAKAMKTALLNAMKQTPVGRTGYARDVLDAVRKVTQLPHSWSILHWE